MTAIPTLYTSRLRLRPMQASDWRAYWALMRSDRSRYMGGPFSDQAAWGLFCHDHAQWDLFGCGALMLDTQDGRTIGQVGVNTGPLFPEYELGWILYPDAEGAGYAYEAATALRDWARDIRKLPTLVSYIDPENTRSARLAERLGARLDATAPRTDPDDLVYRHFGAATT